MPENQAFSKNTTLPENPELRLIHHLLWGMRRITVLKMAKVHIT
jgi:hypothetical protein